MTSCKIIYRGYLKLQAYPQTLCIILLRSVKTCIDSIFFKIRAYNFAGRHLIFKSAYARCITPSDLQITPCKFARRHTISKSAYALCIAPDFFQICSCSTFFYCKTTLLSLEVQHASTFFNVTICGDTFLKHVWRFRFRTCALKKGKRMAII